MTTKAVQKFLKVSETGKWDWETVEATVKLQKKHNKIPTGLPNNELYKLIQSLKDSKKGAAVRKQSKIKPNFKNKAR